MSKTNVFSLLLLLLILLPSSCSRKEEALYSPGLGGVISPQAFLFPRYSGELTLEGDQTVIVSRGLGTHTIHLRLFNTPELVSISLEPAMEKKIL